MTTFTTQADELQADMLHNWEQVRLWSIAYHNALVAFHEDDTEETEMEMEWAKEAYDRAMNKYLTSPAFHPL